ncbi:MAG: UDP-N-acetylglucosamine--N-acetylmuramyl-(pentapeptide) pyrophosphoryl-undecaprenol N-acetylglucosamine transferase, partial [Sciscionella sp.]
KVGARFAAAVAAAVGDCGLADAEVIGVPLRAAITGLDRPGLRAAARAHFGLDPEAPTLLVTGGSQGARSLNAAVSGCASSLAAAGIGVLHAHGPRNTLAVQQVRGAPSYVSLPYIERMDLAYAAADLVLCRSGMMTVAELSAIGLPAVFVPLPHGNGEQALNAGPVVHAGGALLVDDAQLHPATVQDLIIPLLNDPARLARMAVAARTGGHRDADEQLATMVLGVIGR